MTISQLKQYIDKNDTKFYALKIKAQHTFIQTLPSLTTMITIISININYLQNIAIIKLITKDKQPYTYVIGLYQDDPYEDYDEQKDYMRIGDFIIAKNKYTIFKQLKKLYPCWMRKIKKNDNNCFIKAYKNNLNKLKKL